MENQPTYLINLVNKPFTTRNFSHQHADYEIALFRHANIDIFIDNTRHHIGPRSLVLINRYVLHNYLYNSFEYERYMLQISSLRETGLLDRVFQLPFQVSTLDIPAFERLWMLFSCAYEDYQNTAARDLPYSLDHLLWEISKTDKLPLTGNTSPSDSVIREVLNYLSEHYMEPFSLGDIAERFHIDPSYLCRKFKKYSGYTMVQYVQYARIKKARALLLADWRIEEILPQCGFENIQHFYSTFKKITSCTPSEFKRQMRQDKH